MTASPDETAIDETALPVAGDQLPVSYSLETLREEVLDGGVPQDGIPSIDDPAFEPVDEVGDRFREDDPVFGVVREGETRAYPQSILVHHEIVNDEIGGESLAVTYCPLTGTAMGLERGDVGPGAALGNRLLCAGDRYRAGRAGERYRRDGPPVAVAARSRAVAGESGLRGRAGGYKKRPTD
jgi:hypothetical protein